MIVDACCSIGLRADAKHEEKVQVMYVLRTSVYVCTYRFGRGLWTAGLEIQRPAISTCRYRTQTTHQMIPTVLRATHLIGTMHAAAQIT